MKLNKLRVLAIVVVLIVVIGIVAWTLTSPPILEAQSETQLQASLFSFAKSTTQQNITDGSGAYTFKFGLDYSSNVIQGEETEVAVYCALTAAQVTSSFARGVALNLQSASLSIDGRQDSGVKTASKFQPGLQIYYIQNINTNIALGLYNITARLILSTIDVNYIGNFQGSTSVVMLNGILNISSASSS